MGYDPTSGWGRDTAPHWGRTVPNAEPLTKIEGTLHQEALKYGEEVTEYLVTCRLCGELPSLGSIQELQQAALQQRRHLSEHLTLLAAEIQEAAR